MFTMSKTGSNERSWASCLMAGICLTSIGLSMVCLAHLFFLPPHSCPCAQTDVVPDTAKDIHTTKTPEKAIEVKADGNHERHRRNVAGMGASNLYQLQSQIMTIQTRIRLMQDEIKRTQLTGGRRGPTGPPGRPGRNGIDGRQGMDGPMGMPGRDGKDGKDGPPGPPGSPGPPGVNGLQGNRGENGLKGMKGQMGDRGEQGLPGPKGSRGPVGRNGEHGEPGNAGPPGQKGPVGKPGSVTCYVTENGRRYDKDCHLAAQDPGQSKDARKPAGVIFYRWGRTTCPVGTRPVYSGQAASVHHGKRRIGGSSYKCVPSKPWYFGQRSPGDSLRNISRLRPRVVDGETGLQASLNYLPCAACLATLRSIQIMIPARKECSRGWHREYDGFLAVQVNRGEQKELMCVDREARGIFGTPDYVMALHADCNSFSCPPYTNAERLPCVVCSM